MSRRLWATSDLHVNHPGNLAALEQLPSYGEDWLIVAGDVAERVEDVERALTLLAARFEKVLWVPGNHELWTTQDGLRGERKYRALVEKCQERGVLTPEDPWPLWPGSDLVLAPMFLLYDYTFGPDGMDAPAAIAWAAEDGIRCADEAMLSPDPWGSRQAWCKVRLAITRARLEALPPDRRTILINHFPLRRDLVRLYRIPRFSPWCGTRETEDWHLRYRAEVVVSGHLHMRSTDWRDGVRFEEVSLGYPRHWLAERGAASYLRLILPAGEGPASGHGGPLWHR